MTGAGQPALDPGPLRVREVSTAAGLDELAPLWEQVLEGSENSTPFLTHAWVRSWWECFGRGRDLWVLVAEDAAGPAAIAPFVRAWRGTGPLRYRALEIAGTGPLRFLGMGLSDRADLLLARRREEAAAAILARLEAERGSWDVADLRFVPETSTTVRVWRELGRAAGLHPADEVCAESPYLRLSGSHAEYLAGRGQKFRKNLRRHERRLGAEGEVAIDPDAGRHDLEAAFAAAAAISRASWKGRQGTALLFHPEVHDFLRLVCQRLRPQARVYLALLTVGGRPAAHELGFRMHDKLWAYDSCFDHRFAAGAPGVLLMNGLLRHAWSEGLAEYDFLRGHEGYKTTWSTEKRRELQVVLATGTRGRAALTVAYRSKWLAKRQPLLVAAQSRLAGLMALAARRGESPRG